MNQFCTECGKKVKKEHQVCIHCGTPLKKTEKNQDRTSKGDAPSPISQSQESQDLRGGKEAIAASPRGENPSLPSQDHTLLGKIKNSNLLWVIVGALGISLLGFNAWAKSYSSAEKVIQRFEKAVGSKNQAAIKKMLIHGDETAITEGEAKAFLDLVQKAEHGVPSFEAVESGKFLLFYPGHKIVTTDYYAYYGESIEELEFLFNDEAFPQDKEGGALHVYGPFVPGLYTVSASFKGEFGESTAEEEVVIYSPHDTGVNLDLGLNLSNVTFYVANYEQLDTKKVHIKIKDKKIAIDENGQTEAIGPMLLNGKQSFEVIAQLPWGQTTSAKFTVEDAHMEVYANLLEDEQFSEASKRILGFAEQYVESLAQKSTKSLTNVSNEVKKSVAEHIDDYSNYSGRLENIEFDRGAMYLEDPEDTKNKNLVVPAKFIVMEDYHAEDEAPVLDAREILFDIGLKHEEESGWSVVSLKPHKGWNFEKTDTLKGSKKLYSLSKGATENAISKAFKTEVTEFIDAYTRASVEAINYRDFSLMEDMIDSSGPRYKEAKEYIDYLESKGITEEYYGIDVEKIQEKGESTWQVTYVEKYNIIKPDDSSYKTFRTNVLIVKKDGSYYVKELLSTKET